ncbi:MAG: hypothetical protein U1E39_13255 [Planctomycetota bacterium]
MHHGVPVTPLAWARGPVPTVVWVVLVVLAAAGAIGFRRPDGLRSHGLIAAAMIQLIAMIVTLTAFDPFLEKDAAFLGIARSAYHEVWILALPAAAIGVVVGFYIALLRGGRLVGLALVAACMFSFWYSADFNV